jgi:hypothetical protein
MNATVARWALVSVLAAAPRVADAALPRFECYPVRAGDSAAKAALRLTGENQNWRASWFQIVDARGRLVRKGDYEEIRPGWRVCLAVERPQPTAMPPPARPDPSPALAPRAAPVSVPRSSIPVSPVSAAWWLAAVGVVALSAALFAVNTLMKERALAHVMQRFGGEFVREFGRPWLHYRGAGPSPQARLRVMPSRARVEILVSPPPGRTYPNLSDHRSNVEYDVARVTAALKHESFACGQPYVEGKWVVLPFHFQGRVIKEGVR